MYKKREKKTFCRGTQSSCPSYCQAFEEEEEKEEEEEEECSPPLIGGDLDRGGEEESERELRGWKQEKGLRQPRRRAYSERRPECFEQQPAAVPSLL